MTGPTACRFFVATPRIPGAIAIIQLVGDVAPTLRAITGSDDWPHGRSRLVRFGDIDDGIVARLSADVAQLMPHGGVRIVQKLTQRLVELGAAPLSADQADPVQLYPEAADRFEALALAALSRAASPLAVDHLLDQPRRWREAAQRKLELSQEVRQRSRRLDRLIKAPMVVLAGPANVGKSTLSNALLGRAMSIALDQPGTTRDYVSGRIDLAGLVVDWHDTPGLRDTTDPIEQRSLELSQRLIEAADLLIAMTDHEHDWPRLPRGAEVFVLNKCDLNAIDDHSTPDWTSPSAARAKKTLIESADGAPASAVLHRISARAGAGLAELVAAVRNRLVSPDDLAHPGPWLFDERLVR